MKRTPLRRKTPLRSRRRVKSLRKRLWPELSKLIRQRDGHCLMRGEFGACSGVLQGSHIHPKGAWPLLELFPLNVKTLCFRHHFYVWNDRPIEMAEWLKRTLPSWWLERLEYERLNVMARKGMTEEAIRAEWAYFFEPGRNEKNQALWESGELISDSLDARPLS